MSAWARHVLRHFLRHLRALMALCALVGAGLVPVVHAQTRAEITQMQVDRMDDGLYLSANVRFELPGVVEDALRKGISMYFVAEADVQRDRWYWYDKKVASATRHMRLSYQPLTRRWRLTVASGQISSVGLGATLGHSFDELSEAMSTIKRLSRWKIAEAAEIELGARHNVELRFRLDVSQLPRPFQIGAVGQPDWSVEGQQNFRLAVETAP
jgi:hypothetical protein